MLISSDKLFLTLHDHRKKEPPPCTAPRSSRRFVLRLSVAFFSGLSRVKNNLSLISTKSQFLLNTRKEDLDEMMRMRMRRRDDSEE